MNLLDLFDRPIAFHRVFATICGDTNAALLLSQAVYWQKIVESTDSGKIIQGKKYFWKTQVEFQNEIALTPHRQLSARKKMQKFDFWNEKKCGIPRKLYFRVSLKKLEIYTQNLAVEKDKSDKKLSKTDKKSEQNQQNSQIERQASQKGCASSADLRCLFLKSAELPRDYPKDYSGKNHPPKAPPDGGGFYENDSQIREYVEFAIEKKSSEIKDLTAYRASLMCRIRRQGGLSEPDFEQLKRWQNQENQSVTPYVRPTSVPMAWAIE